MKTHAMVNMLQVNFETKQRKFKQVHINKVRDESIKQNFVKAKSENELRLDHLSMLEF